MNHQFGKIKLNDLESSVLDSTVQVISYIDWNCCCCRESVGGWSWRWRSCRWRCRFWGWWRLVCPWLRLVCYRWVKCRGRVAPFGDLPAAESKLIQRRMHMFNPFLPMERGGKPYPPRFFWAPVNKNRAIGFKFSDFSFNAERHIVLKS